MKTFVLCLTGLQVLSWASVAFSAWSNRRFGHPTFAFPVPLQIPFAVIGTVATAYLWAML